MAHILPVPYHRQQTDYTCGPATLRMIFSYYDLPMTERQVAHLAGTTKEGTTPTGLVRALRHTHIAYRRTARADMTDLTREIRHGNPVIVHYREPQDDESHYALAIGMTNSEIVLHDAYNGRSIMIPKKEFARRWIGYRNYPHRDKGWMIAVGGPAERRPA